MTIYEFLKTLPMERVSALQKQHVLHRHTMRNLVIYEQFLAERNRAALHTSHILRPPTVMDAYAAVADRNDMSEDQVQRIVLRLQHSLSVV